VLSLKYREVFSDVHRGTRTTMFTARAAVSSAAESSAAVLEPCRAYCQGAGRRLKVRNPMRADAGDPEAGCRKATPD